MPHVHCDGPRRVMCCFLQEEQQGRPHSTQFRDDASDRGSGCRSSAQGREGGEHDQETSGRIGRGVHRPGGEPHLLQGCPPVRRSLAVHRRRNRNVPATRTGNKHAASVGGTGGHSQVGGRVASADPIDPCVLRMRPIERTSRLQQGHRGPPHLPWRLVRSGLGAEEEAGQSARQPAPVGGRGVRDNYHPGPLRGKRPLRCPHPGRQAARPWSQSLPP